jgi:outer membrane lipoprotein-sorting protein
MKRLAMLLISNCLLINLVSVVPDLSRLTIGSQAVQARAAVKPEAEVVLDEMETAGKKLTSLVAKLSQQKINTQLGIKEQEEVGEIRYIPGKNGSIKLRIDITKPAARTIVISGDEVKFYEREVNQLLITSLKNKPKTKSYNSLAITLGSVNAIRANYEVSYLKDEVVGTEKTAVLHLVPKEASNYKEVDIWISRNNWLPVQQRFTEKNGDILTLRLSDLKLNEKFNVKSLIDEFKPAGAKVVKD